MSNLKKGPIKKNKSSNKNIEKKTDLSNENDAFDAIFGGDFGSLEIGNYIGSTEDDGTTKHLPDAVDFEDEDELADEELPEEPDAVSKKINLQTTHRNLNGLDNINTDEDLMNVPFGNGITNDDDFLSSLPHDGSQVMDTELPNNEFQGGNNALFMGMDNDNMIYMDHQTSFGGFPMDDNQDLNQTGDGSFQHIVTIPGAGSQIQSDSTKLEQHEEQAQLELAKKHEKAKTDKLLLKYYFPDFKKGKILKWNRAIYRRKSKYQWHHDLLATRPTSSLIPVNLKFQVQADQKRLFKLDESSKNAVMTNLLSKNKKKHGIVTIAINDIYPEEIKESSRNEAHHQEISEDLLIATDDWDEEKIINGINSSLTIRPTNNQISFEKLFFNKLDDTRTDWNWNEDDLVDAKLKLSKKAELDMNDEKLLLLLDDGRDAKSRKLNKVISTNLPINEKTILQKFNISNDEAYNILRRTHQPKVRATISNLNIEHSQPAVKLQSPFYKVNPSRLSLRYYHRPRFGQHLRPGMVITFSKLKTRKRKRDKGKDIKESFAVSQDLTVGDTAPVYLMEYSEQTPLALSKFGMSNKLINYYRKVNDQDMLRPKLSVGETHVLGVQDKSPFWNFGFVESGHIVPTLYNNMVRAPVFKHDVSGTDFLLIRSTGNGISNRFYLRNINHLFTVGQTFPLEEIPGPNSRKVTSMRTTRLRMIVYRILNNSPNKAISIEPITKHFPDQDYGQNRQKIKEFMKYQREGPDKGLWKLKDGEPLLDNESAKKLISPEQVSELESMSQGLQFWEDNENFNFDENLLKLEENLLPWNSTKNFINATQMRAMVQIHGAGDPTGCGEGFSFLKTSMKGGFVKSHNSESGVKKSQISANNGSSHSYNVVQQQKAYDEEISKTWYTHAKSLSVTNPFEEIDDPDEINVTNRHFKTNRDDGKVLRITYKRRDQNGIIQRQTIIIRDPRVIKGYIKGKEIRKKANLDVNKLLEDDNTYINNVEDIEMQKKLLQSELASLEKSQQRRAARQSSKKKVVGEDGKVGKNTKRRCATCGQTGHIRTNKSCPMYHLRNQVNNGSTPIDTATNTESNTPVNTAPSPINNSNI